MRNWRTDLESAEIRRSSSKAIRHIGQNRASVHCGGGGLEPEVEIRDFIEFLKRADVLGIEPANIHEDVVIHENAIAILTSRLTVLGESRIIARFKIRTESRSQRTDRDIEWR